MQCVNQEMTCLVDMEIGICSCAIGCSGAACKHQAAVAKHFKLITINVAPVKPGVSAVIARGQENSQCRSGRSK